MRGIPARIAGEGLGRGGDMRRGLEWLALQRKLSASHILPGYEWVQGDQTLVLAGGHSICHLPEGIAELCAWPDAVFRLSPTRSLTS